MDAPAPRERDVGDNRIDFKNAMTSAVNTVLQQNSLKSIVLDPDSVTDAVYWANKGKPITDVTIHVELAGSAGSGGADQKVRSDARVLGNKLREIFKPGVKVTGDDGQQFIVSPSVNLNILYHSMSVG